MHRRVFAACGVAMAVAVAVAAPAPPASAATPTTLKAMPVAGLERGAPAATQDVIPYDLSDCPSHTLCLWDYSRYQGNLYQFPLSRFGYNTWYYVGNSANDKATSLYSNRGYCTLIAKDSPPRTPNIVYLGPGEALNNLRYYNWPDGSIMNNSISAFALLNYCP